MESVMTEDRLKTDLLQRNTIKNSLQDETNKLHSEVRTLDFSYEKVAKQNMELKEKRQRLEAELLTAKIYLEEETRTLNMKELRKADLQKEKAKISEEREKTYAGKRTKEKEHREASKELASAKEMVDKEHREINNIKRDVTQLEVKGEFLKGDIDDEITRRDKKLKETKDTLRTKLEKEEKKHQSKVESAASQITTIIANSKETQQLLSIERTKIEETREKSDELSSKTRNIVKSLDAEVSTQREASRAQENLLRDIQMANDFLAQEQQDQKKRNNRAKHRAEEHIKKDLDSIDSEKIQKVGLEHAREHISRDIDLVTQDAKLAERDAKKTRQEQLRLAEEKEKLRQDILLEAERNRHVTAIGSANKPPSKLPQEIKETAVAIAEINRETASIEDKIDSLKLASFKLGDTKSSHLFDLQLAKVKEESERVVQERDRKVLKKLQEQREELNNRLDNNLKEQEGKSEKDKKDLLIEEEFIRKRKREIEKLIQEERKKAKKIVSS